MALQNYGTITMDDIGREFQGPKPYDLESHRRGAGKVPSQIPGTMNPPTGGNPTRSGYVVPSTVRCDATGPWNPANDECWGRINMWCNHPDGLEGKPQIRIFDCPSGNTHEFLMPCYAIAGPGSACGEKWFGINPYKPLLPDLNVPDGGWITAYSYQNGSDPSPNPPSPNPPGPNPPNPVVPGYMNPPVPINTNVPTSGRIAVDDFYGARR